MKEKILSLAQLTIANKKILLGACAGIAVLLGGVILFGIRGMNNPPLAETTGVSGAIPEVEVAIVGATSSADVSAPEQSWPGELVSLSNVPIQPPRDGTIASWNVHVGEKVFAGQVLGTLAQSPQMPDAVAMVAEKASEATMSRANVEAKRAYTSERITALVALRENTEQSLRASQALLGSGVSSSNDLSMISAKKEVVRAILRSTYAKTYPMLSGSLTLPSTWSAITLLSPIGAQNTSLRDKFPAVVFAVKHDLDTPDTLPVASGLAYYELMIKLADASLPDGATLSDTTLLELKSMLHDNQQSFIMAADEVKKTELMAVDTKKSSFEQLQEIDNEIASLKQDLAMAEGEVAAKEVAYQTVRNGVQSRTAITAPKAGIVSSIAKKVGEFVGPGMPVAVVTGESGSDYVVRFRIPTNVQKPAIGQEFYVTRPGFPEVMPLAKLIGVGNSLDDTGSVMADALLLEHVDWPVGISLRVVLASESSTVEIALGSVWWDATGGANVWSVSGGGRVYAKKVTLGRTLGDNVEIYAGLARGDRYIAKPNSSITEDMLIDDVKTPATGGSGESSYDAAMRAMGM